MAVKQKRKVIELRNIGKKIAGRLNEAGIFTEDELRAVGAVEAHNRIRGNHPDETLPVCYYLHSFEGALLDVHWDRIGERKKQALKEEID